MVVDPDLVLQADAADVLPTLADGSFQLIYLDPPFNTGKAQQRPHAHHRPRRRR